ncbi:MAG: NAD(P)-dependent oxidoreductase [Ruminococcaceae bacterium]|nr:NAD(P)-dependent oxidoreductase [Oscillospiraceae bacterium]
MNVMITGAGGFIGRNLIDSLVKENHHIYVIVKEGTDIQQRYPDITVLTYTGNYHDLISQIHLPIDIFYNLAWSGTSGPKRNDEYIQINNIRESCDAIHFASEIKARRFVFFASIMEYDIFNKAPLEMSPQNTTMYSLAKYAAHYFTNLIARRSEMEFITAIISNIYGPGEISKRFVYVMLNKMLQGDIINLSSCKQPYDFIYITDAIRQIRAVGESGKNFETYYIGNSQQRELRYYVEKMNRIVGKNAQLNYATDTSNVVYDYYAKFETNKVEKELHILPQVSFEEGIKKTLDWVKKND